LVDEKSPFFPSFSSGSPVEVSPPWTIIDSQIAAWLGECRAPDIPTASHNIAARTQRHTTLFKYQGENNDQFAL
jgi:hypothetical protein